MCGKIYPNELKTENTSKIKTVRITSVEMAQKNK
jgi:hypothetical protein